MNKKLGSQGNENLIALNFDNKTKRICMKPCLKKQEQQKYMYVFRTSVNWQIFQHYLRMSSTSYY